eukprot:1140019-Pelagomonas_calceolata.AAC.4
MECLRGCSHSTRLFTPSPLSLEECTFQDGTLFRVECKDGLVQGGVEDVLFQDGVQEWIVCKNALFRMECKNVSLQDGVSAGLFAQHKDAHSFTFVITKLWLLFGHLGNGTHCM